MSNPLEDAKKFRTVNVSAERIARVYADALFRSAGAEADAVGEELRELVVTAFTEVPDLYPFLASGTIATKTKREFIDRHFQDKASETLVSFLQVLNSHNRLELLPAIAVCYRAELDEKHKRMRVLVRSAVSLDDGQRAALKKQLNEMFLVEPMLNEEVDPEFARRNDCACRRLAV